MLYRIIIPGAALALFAGAIQAELVDDFDGDSIDFGKWRSYGSEFTTEVVRDIDVNEGMLELHIGSSGASGSPDGTTQTILIVNDDPEEAIEAKVELTELEPGASGAWSALEGYYYNADTASATDTDRTGDVYAAISFGDFGSGLAAYYVILESDDAAFTTWTTVDNGTLVAPGTLSTDTIYTGKIAYDGSDGFTFTFAGNTVTTSGNPRVGEAGIDYQSLATYAEDGSAPVSATARFDDVVVNNRASVYDDFSGDRLDPARWFHDPSLGFRLGTVREASGGKLHLATQGVEVGSARGPRERLFLSEINPDYFEARVAIPAGVDLDDNISGVTGITGYLYNERRDGGDQADPYDGFDGDVYGTVYLFSFNGNLGAGAYLESELSDFSTDEVYIDDEQFPVQIEAGREYRLWMRRTSDQIIFGLDDETIAHDVTTPMHDPSPSALGGYRTLRTWINGTRDAASDAGGIMRATFDDVRTSAASGDDGGSGGSGGDSGSDGGGDGTGGSDDGGGGGGAIGVGLLLGLGAGAALRRRRSR